MGWKQLTNGVGSVQAFVHEVYAPILVSSTPRYSQAFKSVDRPYPLIIYSPGDVVVYPGQCSYICRWWCYKVEAYSPQRQVESQQTEAYSVIQYSKAIMASCIGWIREPISIFIILTGLFITKS